MIAALYVDPKGCYANVDGVDPWPESRDARLYAGPWPVVAHPPCASWCRLAGFREATHGYPRGEDGGTFEAALDAVRTYGGVLEHPAHSDAWLKYDLPPPPWAGWQRGICGGWSCHVEQGRYGKEQKKATWLYAYGTDSLPSLKWGRTPDQSSPTPSRYKNGSKLISKLYREGSGGSSGSTRNSATPIEFRDLLIGIARGCAEARGGS